MNKESAVRKSEIQKFAKQGLVKGSTPRYTWTKPGSVFELDKNKKGHQQKELRSEINESYKEMRESYRERN